MNLTWEQLYQSLHRMSPEARKDNVAIYHKDADEVLSISWIKFNESEKDPTSGILDDGHMYLETNE